LRRGIERAEGERRSEEIEEPKDGECSSKSGK